MKLPDRALCLERLALIFPESLGERGRVTNQLAASAVFVCLFVDAIGRRRRIRPSMVLWMCDEAANRMSAAERDAWYSASLHGKRSLTALLRTWGIDHRPWYADNTREPLRDETFRSWLRLGAIERDESVQTTSSKPQWSLSGDFAALFDPELGGDTLTELVADWHDDHLGTLGRTRIALARRLGNTAEQVIVRLPDGTSRPLAPGGSSLILKGVIEELAPRLLAAAAVLFISESRQHLDVIDRTLLDQLGIEVDSGRILPDALLFDVSSDRFWFVEVVYTDGPIDEPRKTALAAWAVSQGIPESRCQYVTAFTSRAAAPFRRLIGELAWGTYAWFVDEPENVVNLERLA